MSAGSLYERDESGPVPSTGERARTIEESEETVLGPGAVIGGKYEVLRVLGAGGMGTVLAARHLELGQTVAIKIMHSDVAAEPDSVKRFMREGRAAAHLRSDHAVRIHDVGRLASGLPFLVMEHLVGYDLDHRRQLEISEVVDYVIQAISAITEAHEGGLVHRDIKPQNLFLATLPDGTARVKVLDFGLAKDLQAVSSGSGALTADHMILGSPHFMSPEQIRTPGQVDARADVWAIGATMVQLLTGAPPYTANNVHGLLARILADPVPKVRELRPDVPIALEKIIERCMEKDRDRRYGSVIELATALQLAIGWVPSGSRITRGSTPDPELPASAPLLAVTRAAPLAPPSVAPTEREIDDVTLHMAPPPRTAPQANVTVPMPTPTVPTPTVPLPPGPVATLPLGQRYERPAAVHAATLVSAAAPAGALAGTPVATAALAATPPPRRIARAWLLAFAVITTAALVVGGLALLRAHQRRQAAMAEGLPTIVAIPPTAATTVAAPPGSTAAVSAAPPHDDPAPSGSAAASPPPSAVPAAPPSGVVVAPQSAVVTAPPSAGVASAPGAVVAASKRPKASPPTTAPPPASAHDPYSWGK